jgi:hypothetical protein
MSRLSGFEDHLTDWLEDGPTDAPDRVLETILAALPSIPQRRVAWRVPWRFQPLNGFARWVAGAAALIIAVGGLVMLNQSPSASVGGPSPTSPPHSVAPSPSATSAAIDTSGWISFTSRRHGETLRYPAGWTATAASEPWTAGLDLTDPMQDAFSLPTNGDEGFSVVSQRLPSGETGLAWLTGYELQGATYYAGVKQCWPAPADMEHTIVAGEPAWVHGGCGFIEAITFVGDRIYVLQLWNSYDRPLLDAFLSTITLAPANADDTPVAHPSSSPSPRSS